MESEYDCEMCEPEACTCHLVEDPWERMCLNCAPDYCLCAMCDGEPCLCGVPSRHEPEPEPETRRWRRFWRRRATA